MMNEMFVGRSEELHEFARVLSDSRGLGVVVTGQAGMGKTMLVNQMARLAEGHPDLKCGWVRYEVTPTDSVDSIIELMMDNAYDAACVEEKSLDKTPHRLEQWRAFLNVLGVGDLIMSLRREPQQNTRDQFRERLEMISERMPDNGRAIFIIDPEKYMAEKSDQAWSIIVRDLPDKIKLVFAQRSDDVLANSGQFGGLKNVVYIPEGKELGVLDDEAIDKLLDEYAAKTTYSVTELRGEWGGIRIIHTRL